MIDVDWSNAQESAEYYSPASELFYREHGGEFQKFSESRQIWMLAAGEKHQYINLIPRPSQQDRSQP